MQLPTFEQYAGPKSLAYILSAPSGDTLKVWHSYQTVVGFALNGKRTVRENEWGPTTGKHLAKIDGGDKLAKAARVPGEAFERALTEALGAFNPGKPGKLAQLGAASLNLLREYHWHPESLNLERFRQGGERTRLGDGMARDGFQKLAILAADLRLS